MVMPFSMDVAKKLKEKGYITDSHFSKFADKHAEYEKAQKMAAGGVVDDDAQAAQDPSDTANTPDQDSDPSFFKGVMSAAYRTMAPNDPYYQQGVDPASENYAAGQTLNGLRSAVNATSLAGIGAKEPVPTPGQPAAAPSDQSATPDQDTTAPTAQTVSLPSDGRDLAQQPGATIQASPLEQYAQGMNDAYDKQNKGINMQASAAEAKGNEQAAIYTNTASKLADAEAARQSYVDKQTDYLNTQMDSLNKQIDNYSQQKIDPNRFWNSKSTGDKVLAGIGMFLGSFGTSNSNLVVDQMNNAIKQDIQAQAQDLQTQGTALKGKQSVYSDMFNLYKNKEAAMAASQVAVMNQAQMQLQGMSSMYSGPEAQGKALELSGKIDAEKQQAKMALNQQLMKMYAIQNPDQYREFLDKDHTENLVPGYKGYTTQPAIAADIIKAKGSADTATSALNQLTSLANLGRAGQLDPTTRAKADVLHNAVIGLIKDEFVGPRLTDADKPILDALVADPMSVFTLNSSQKARLVQLKGLIQDGVDSKAKAAGLMPYSQVNNLKTQQNAPPPMGSSNLIKTSARK